MNEAQKALRMIERGENPLDNYEIVKKAILQSDNALDLIWNEIPPEISKELVKDKDIKKKFTAYKKELERQIKELGKGSVTYKFKNADEYEKWLKKKKDTVQSDQIQYDIEMHWPILEDTMDKLFFEMDSKAQVADFGNGVKEPAFKISDLPNKSSLARQIVGILSRPMLAHVKKMIKKYGK